MVTIWPSQAPEPSIEPTHIKGKLRSARSWCIRCGMFVTSCCNLKQTKQSDKSQVKFWQNSYYMSHLIALIFVCLSIFISCYKCSVVVIILV